MVLDYTGSYLGIRNLKVKHGENWKQRFGSKTRRELTQFVIGIFYNRV